MRRRSSRRASSSSARPRTSFSFSADVSASRRATPREDCGAHQLQLTIADLIDESHDVHHPLGPTLYYEDQKAESQKRAKEFLGARMPKYLHYFERVIELNRGGRGLIGRGLTYPDLSMAQVLAGLEYAFPRSTVEALRSRPRLA